MAFPYMVSTLLTLLAIIFVVVLSVWLFRSPIRHNKKIYTIFRGLTERRGGRQLTVVNGYRKRKGLQSLHAYYDLDNIANKHSYYLAKHKKCNHDGFENRAAQVRSKTGSSYVAENCFKYPAKEYNRWVAEKLVEGWMKSEGHRRNLMNPQFSKVGIGIVVKYGYVYATQIFSS